MKSLVNRKLTYIFPDKSSDVTEYLIITRCEMKNKVLFIDVYFENKKKYIEHSEKFHRFNIYNLIDEFSQLLTIDNFNLTIN